MRRQRQLHQDAVDIVAAVEIVDQRQQFFGGGCLQRRVLLAQDAQLFAGLHLATNVNFRRRIVANQHHGQSGPKPVGGELLDLFADFGANLRRDFGSVENDCWHAPSGMRTNF